MAIITTIDNVPAGRIKPSLLSEELAAAGLDLMFEYRQGPGYCDCTFQENNAVALQAVLDAHDPNGLSSADILDQTRLSDTEDVRQALVDNTIDILTTQHDQVVAGLSEIANNWDAATTTQKMIMAKTALILLLETCALLLVDIRRIVRYVRWL